MDSRTIEQLKEHGQGLPAPDAVVRNYQRAFAEFGLRTLWHRRPSLRPTIAQALIVAECLRTNGNLKARRLAAEIEAACRAAL